MLKIAYFAVTCGLLVSLFFCFERPAYAYIDPGSGLFLLQGLGSVTLGVFYFFRRRLKALLDRAKGSQGTTQGTNGNLT
jgi:hypothetical protein